MADHTGGQPSGEPDAGKWTFRLNPAVRALLDHVAEELAAEFVRLTRASVEQQSEAEPKEKGR
jgi:hypothetical protein